MPRTMDSSVNSGFKVNTGYRQIWSIAYPVMISSLVENIVSLAGSYYLGHYGRTELAAALLGNIFCLMLATMIGGLAMAAQIVISQNAGAGNHDAIRSYFRHSVVLNCLFAVALTVAAEALLPFVLPSLISSPRILAAAKIFIAIRVCGIVFSSILRSYAALYVGIARTSVISVATILMSATNIFFTGGLIFGRYGFPGMGIAGAGLAGVISTAVGAVFYYAFTRLYTEKHFIQLSGAVTWSRDKFRKILVLGAPLTLQFLLTFGGWLLFFFFLEKTGEVNLGASNLLVTLYLFLCVPAWGFSAAANTMTGNLKGQGRFREFRRVLAKILALNVLFVSATSLIAMVYAPAVLSLFTNETAVIAAGTEPLRVLSVATLFFSLGMNLSSVVTGFGQTRYVFYVEVVAQVIYLVYSYWIVFIAHGSLSQAWTNEYVYWIAVAAPNGARVLKILKTPASV